MFIVKGSHSRINAKRHANMGTEYISMYEACSNETHLGLFWAKE
jgi:hypothetical protein